MRSNIWILCGIVFMIYLSLKEENKEETKMEINSVIEHKKLARQGYDLHYFVSGSADQETIIFLHPAFGDHQCFNHQVDYFSRSFRVITLDMLGHGLTGVGQSKEKIGSTHHHIAEIMKKEGIETAHIAGVSLGSLIAQDFALKHPEKVLSLTALGGYSINRDQTEVEKSQRKVVFGFLYRYLFSMDNFRRHAASFAVKNELEQQRFFECAQGFTRKSVTVMMDLDKLIEERPNVQRDYPLLILVGDKDEEMALRKAKEWHKEEPKSQFKIIENAGHCANMDNAEKFNALLMGFLKTEDKEEVKPS